MGAGGEGTSEQPWVLKTPSGRSPDNPVGGGTG
jgi:hypothetical protein